MMVGLTIANDRQTSRVFCASQSFIEQIIAYTQKKIKINKSQKLSHETLYTHKETIMSSHYNTSDNKTYIIYYKEKKMK